MSGPVSSRKKMVPCEVLIEYHLISAVICAVHSVVCSQRQEAVAIGGDGTEVKAGIEPDSNMCVFLLNVDMCCP